MSAISAVQGAVDRGEWQNALDLLADAGVEAEGPEALELLARAHYGNGDFEASVAAWEQLHQRLVADYDTAGAAMAAAMVSMYLLMDTGLMATVRGWLRKAQRLLVDHEPTPAHAMIAVVQGYERFLCGDMQAAGQNAARGVELGTELGFTPAVVIGRVCAARVRVFDGEMDEGLELLDEIALDLMSGDVDPLTTGMMYCELICAAQGMALHERATEWTDVMERWRHGAAIGGISGRCRVHRAELLRVSGPCDAAEDEALGACDELRPFMRREFGWPLVELGTIRLRKGDLAGAEEAFMAAHERAWSPHPGLALLRLEQGDLDAASSMIADAIAHPFDVPWKERPPFGDLRLAPLLDAQAEIATAVGDLDAVRSAADALDSIAKAFPSRWLQASAQLAAARRDLLAGDLDQAIHASKAATAGWADLAAPYEAAVARSILGQARAHTGDTDGARMEWRAACSAFEQFGAARRVERTERLLAEPASSPAAPAARHDQPASATFRCDGDTRSIEFGERAVLMRDLKGLRYIARLLADPGREFHVLDLIAVEQGSLPTGRVVEPGADHVAAEAGGGLPVLDDTARESYRRRLAEVEEDIDEATRMNDFGRVELAERDREYLIAELTRAVGLGGRHRSVGATSERARTSVTRSLRYAIERLDEHHPPLAAHLRHHVSTGTYCVYSPDPLTPIDWQI